jgi:hypothetical protein
LVPNRVPLSLGHVLDELNIEIEGFEVPKVIDRAIKPFGNIPADFSPASKRPPSYPRFVVMEAKWGYHAKGKTTDKQKLKDDEWEKRLGTTSGSGRQMSTKWIDDRINDIFPIGSAKHRQIYASSYARWLYGCQPHKSSNAKVARARGGKRVQGLAFFPPYELRGFDIDSMPGWKV